MPDYGSSVGSNFHTFPPANSLPHLSAGKIVKRAHLHIPPEHERQGRHRCRLPGFQALCQRRRRAALPEFAAGGDSQGRDDDPSKMACLCAMDTSGCDDVAMADISEKLGDMCDTGGGGDLGYDGNDSTA